MYVVYQVRDHYKPVISVFRAIFDYIKRYRNVHFVDNMEVSLIGI